MPANLALLASLQDEAEQQADEQARPAGDEGRGGSLFNSGDNGHSTRLREAAESVTE